MKIMVVGGGGREHAIVKAIKRNPRVEEIYALPGNAGISEDAVSVDIKAADIDGMVRFAAEHSIDFAVVAPDDPLVLGAADALEEAGIPVFGPNKRAALIEGSKVFSKDLMKKYDIPTAQFVVCDSYTKALKLFMTNDSYPVVIKADGLALGKGVAIVENRDEAVEIIDAVMKDRVFGSSGDRVVVEQFLTGPEVSVLCFTDGKTILPMVSSMDHKPAYDGNRGPNTGGMGTVAPNRHYTKEIADRCMEEIFLPTVNAMNKEGRSFKGCLFFGLMLTGDGPKVIEYNCRFGDPETQVVLPLLKTDLLDIMQAVAEERLSEIDIEWEDGAACCVVMASGGYPGAYETGKPICFGNVKSLEDVFVYHAGTKKKEGGIVTSGGRVLGVTARGKTREEAIERAYRGVDEISFDGAFCRRDIGLL